MKKFIQSLTAMEFAYIWTSIFFVGLSLVNMVMFHHPLFTTPFVEEIGKYLPMVFKRFKVVPYSIGAAFVFTVGEFLFNIDSIYASGSSIDIVLRLLPHFIFAGLFILGSRKSRWLGLALAITGHIIWNYLVLTYK